MGWREKECILCCKRELSRHDESVLSLLHLAINIYCLLLIVVVIKSWVAPQSRHPVFVLLESVTEPLVAPIRRLLPAQAGFDFSPLLVVLALRLIQRLL